jgi:hypothetical protein
MLHLTKDGLPARGALRGVTRRAAGHALQILTLSRSPYVCDPAVESSKRQ